MIKEKLVPKRRFKEFENNDAWEQRKLEDVASNIGDGLHGTPQYTENKNIFFINGNNLVDGKVIITDDTKRVGELERSPEDKALDKNTILMSINGTIGNLALYNGERLMLGKSVSYIMTKKSDRKFIFYTLQTKAIRKYFFDSLTGSTIKNLGLKAIKDTNILIPNKQEQIQISTFFNNLDNLITLHQRKLKKLKEIKSAYLSDMFPKEGENIPKLRFAGFDEPWNNYKLEYLIDKGGSGGTPTTTIKEYYEGNISFLSISDITSSNGFIYNTEKKISEKGLVNSAAWIVPKESISLAMYASVGKVAILKKDIATSQAFFNIVIFNLIIRDFIYHYLRKMYDEKLWNKLISTGTQSNLNAKKVKKLDIVMPKKNEEIKRIGMFLNNIDNQIKRNEEKLKKLKELKESYLNEMFV